MKKEKKLLVQGLNISIFKSRGEDYISLTDMINYGEFAVVKSNGL